MAGTKVLVTYASRMGGTAGIAEAIGDQLRRCGHPVDVRNAADVGSLHGYEVVVLGSAIYARGWCQDAVRFLRRHRSELRERQVWLFHSGPIGPDRDAPQTAPPNVARLIRKIGAAEPMTFAGRLEQDSATGVVSRWLARGQLAGDFRDWLTIKQWARHIHESIQGVDLTLSPSGVGPSGGRTGSP